MLRWILAPAALLVLAFVAIAAALMGMIMAGYSEDEAITETW